MNSTLAQHRHTRTALLFAAAVVSFSAHAEIDSSFLGNQDSKYFSGALCSATRHADLLVSKNGQAHNTSTSFALDITCPLERDMTNTTTMQVRLWVAKSSTEDMKCFLSARKLDNSGGSLASTVVSGTGTKMVTLGPLAALGAYNVGCNVPKANSASGGRSGIVGIELLETN